MADAADMEALARRYLDLWQEHLNAVAGDRETADVMARTMALMSSGAQMFAAQTQAAEGATEVDQTNTTTGAETGAATVTPASGDSKPEHAQLLERIAAVEERLAKLESGAATGGKGARGGTRKPRS